MTYVEHIKLLQEQILAVTARAERAEKRAKEAEADNERLRAERRNNALDGQAALDESNNEVTTLRERVKELKGLAKAAGDLLGLEMDESATLRKRIEELEGLLMESRVFLDFAAPDDHVAMVKAALNKKDGE